MTENTNKPKIYINKEDGLNVLISRVEMVFRSINDPVFSIPVKEFKDKEAVDVKVEYSYLYTNEFLSEFLHRDFIDIKETIERNARKKFAGSIDSPLCDLPYDSILKEELISSLMTIYEEIFKDINRIHTFVCNYRVNVVNAAEMFMDYCDEIGLANNRTDTVASLLNSSYFYRENKELHYTTLVGMRNEKKNLPNINSYMTNILKHLNTDLQ